MLIWGFFWSQKLIPGASHISIWLPKALMGDPLQNNSDKIREHCRWNIQLELDESVSLITSNWYWIRSFLRLKFIRIYTGIKQTPDKTVVKNGERAYCNLMQTYLAAWKVGEVQGLFLDSSCNLLWHFVPPSTAVLWAWVSLCHTLSVCVSSTCKVGQRGPLEFTCSHPTVLCHSRVTELHQVAQSLVWSSENSPGWGFHNHPLAVRLWVQSHSVFSMTML